MVFIVSDQRIATENFEKGKIYKVVFLDESIFYGVCLGIGSNFVMLSGNISGYLFPLTMETASQVESIDLYTPVEPEPPVPPMTNLLQYQTGLPPFSFNTSWTNLWSYYIKGNTGGVGKRTGNLFSCNIEQGTITAEGALRSADNRVRTDDFILMEMGEYTINALSESGTLRILVFEYMEDGTFVSRTPTDWANCPYTFSLTGKRKMKFVFSFSSGNITPVMVNSVMLNSGSTALPYEPYGYKIPIVCGGQTTNIYIDNPIGANDILYSTQTGIQIPTIVGDNTLSVNTTVQPSEMQIVYKIADR